MTHTHHSGRAQPALHLLEPERQARPAEHRRPFSNQRLKRQCRSGHCLALTIDAVAGLKANNQPVTAVPEPGSLALAAAAIAGLGANRRQPPRASTAASSSGVAGR